MTREMQNDHNHNEMIGRRIGEIVRDSGVTVDEYARKAGLDAGRLHQATAGQLTLSFDEKRAIARHSGLTEGRRSRPGDLTPEDLDSLLLPGPDQQLRLDLPGL